MAGYHPPKEATDPRYRLLPSVLQHVARTTPDRVYCAQPTTPYLDDGLYEVTFAQVDTAVDALSFHLEQTRGRSSTFDTLAFVGVNDLRYPLFLLACIKTGHKITNDLQALFISPRNTPEQNGQLLSAARCTSLYYSSEYEATATRISGACVQRPGIELLRPAEHWIASSSRPYPYNKTYEEARYDTILVLHSSGSTGPPKPVVENNQFFINYAKPYPCSPGKRSGGFELFNYEGGGYYFSSFPSYHLGGVSATTVFVIFSRSASLLTGFADRPTSAETTAKLLSMRPTKLLFAPPSIVEGIVRLPQGLDTLQGLETIVFAGGPLNSSYGDLLSKSVNLCSSFGSTETGNAVSYVSEPDDWQYMDFHPAWKPTFEEYMDKTYELVLYRDEDADWYRPIGATILREQDVFRTKDLFVRHEHKPHLWKFYGRKDDIIVLSNGQKWNPLPSESHILSNTKATGVLIVGVGRTVPAALIEIDAPEEDVERQIEELWPGIQQANSQTQRYGRITRSKIATFRPGTFVRTPKGTVVRESTLRSLQSAIDQLYEDAEGMLPDAVPDFWDGASEAKQPLPVDMLPIVRKCIHAIPTVADIQDESDLFVHGLDSNEAAEAAQTLRATLRAYVSLKDLGFLRSHFVFNNPTIESLAAALQAQLIKGLPSVTIKATASSMIEKYSHRLVAEESPKVPLTTKLEKVAVTGTTGSLGTQILEKLLETDSVIEVLCLNRNPEAKSNFETVFGSHPGKSKATFITVNFNEPGLGLKDKEVLLLRDVDAIVHCAWEVNFNRSISTYEHQFRALTDLVDSSVRGQHRTRLLFVSSTSAVPSDDPDLMRHGRVPATLVTETDSPVRMGYAVSKNVGEHLVAIASERLGLPASILRVGQIAGSSTETKQTAAWNRKEWFPSLIDTSAAMGMLPSDLSDIDWVPVDVVAKVVVDLVLHDSNSSELKIYNIINPKPAAWAPLATAINSCLNPPCKLVPFGSWLESLEKENQAERPDVKRFPSLKILPFFKQRTFASETAIQIDTASTCAASGTLAQLKQVKEEQVRFWMAQWGYKSG